MAAQLDPIWVPSATDVARARVTAFAEFATRTYGYHRGSSSLYSYLDVQQGTGPQQQACYLTWAQLDAEVQALNPRAESPWTRSLPVTSQGAAS
jgi:hypothetical protein